jgi:hypothetical protein
MRPQASSGRTTERTASAMPRSAASPAAWPCSSLTVLKRSTSIASSASVSAVSSEAASRSWNAVWLSSPVSASVRDAAHREAAEQEGRGDADGESDGENAPMGFVPGQGDVEEPGDAQPIGGQERGTDGLGAITELRLHERGIGGISDNLE